MKTVSKLLSILYRPCSLMLEGGHHCYRNPLLAKGDMGVDILSPLKEARFLDTNVAATPS